MSERHVFLVKPLEGVPENKRQETVCLNFDRTIIQIIAIITIVIAVICNSRYLTDKGEYTGFTL